MEQTSAPTSKASIETASVDDLASLTATMLNSGRYSDLTIKCHGKVFNVHRNVVCLQSRPLAAAVDGGFQEGMTGVIDLEDDDPDTIEQMVNFFYLRDYSDGRPIILPAVEAKEENGDYAAEIGMKKGKGKGKKKGLHRSSSITSQTTDLPPITGAVILNAKMYIAADKYDIPVLKTLSKTKYQSAILEEWNNEHFATSLKLLYENTMENDRMFKDIAIEVAAKNISQLIDRGEFVELLKANGEIAFDVLKASLTLQFKPCIYCHSSTYISRYASNNNYYHCSSCGEDFNN